MVVKMCTSHRNGPTRTLAGLCYKQVELQHVYIICLFRQHASTGMDDMFYTPACSIYHIALFPVHCSACMSLHGGEPIYIWLLCFGQNTNSSTACLGKSKEKLVCSVTNPWHWLLGYEQ